MNFGVFILLLATLASPAKADPTDPFLTHLQAEWRRYASPKLPYDLQTYFQLIARKDWENAGHFYGHLKSQVPSHLETSVRLSYLYSLYHLGLAQSFLDEWLDALDSKKVRASALEKSLEATLSPQILKWLLAKAPSIAPAQIRRLKKLTAGRAPSVFLNLLAWAELRSGTESIALRTRLGTSHPLRKVLTKTAIAHLASQPNPEAALKLLEEESANLPIAYRELTRGRLFYQMGRFPEASQAYQRLLKTSPFQVSLREELLWTWLRMGDFPRLRGELVSLKSHYHSQARTGSLDIPFLMALSHLKLCYFESAAQEMENLDQEIRFQMTKVEKALTESAEPPRLDLFMEIQSRRQSAIKAELHRVGELEAMSVEGPAPLFGVQRHWSELKRKLQLHERQAETNLEQEYRRYWNYRRLDLRDAERRLQFLKVELQNQIRHHGQAVLSEKEQGPLKAVESRKREKVLQSEKDPFSFPVDKVLWADEIFKIQSVAQNRCLAAKEKTP